jgi:ABC-type spermidine/putrescine transport system permease subunit I
MIFNSTLSAEDIVKVNEYINAKATNGLADYSQIVLEAYENQKEVEEENNEKVPDSLNVPSSPVDEKGSKTVIIVVIVTAVCVVAAFAVAVVIIRKKKH